MSAGRGISENGQKPGAVVPLLRYIAVGTITGLGFGLVMAIVSNGFVLGVKALSSLREGNLSELLRFGDVSFSFAPVVSLLVAVAAILVVRRTFGIKRWHGPADAIHAAHRSDNELDVKSGFGSTLAAFISASGGASVGQYGPLVHFGATMGSFLRQTTGSTLSTDIFIGCGVAGAIAAGFNAPIAGIVFAHEAVLRHFSMRAIAPIAIASDKHDWNLQERPAHPPRCRGIPLFFAGFHQRYPVVPENSSLRIRSSRWPGVPVPTDNRSHRELRHQSA